MTDRDSQGFGGTTPAVLRLRALSKQYADGDGVRVVLEEIGLCVDSGSMVAVHGRSGCGKTTLLNIAAGLLRPDSGNVDIAGTLLDYRRPTTLARVRRDNVGVVAQDYRLLPDESVFENIALPLRFGPARPGRSERTNRVERAMSEADVDVDARRKIRTLSGGQRQRVAVARGLVREPALLIADEPTAALDSETGAHVAALLRRVAHSGVALLVATHDPVLTAEADASYRFSGPHLVRDDGDGQGDYHNSE